MTEMRILSTLIAGIEISTDALLRGVELGAEVICGQGTTADMGAHPFGVNSLYPRGGGKEGIKKNVEQVIVAATSGRIPLFFSGGLSGHDLGLEGVLQCVDEVTQERGLTLRLAVISGEIDKQYLVDKITNDLKIPRLVGHPSLDPFLRRETVERCAHIVAQMGPEPFMKAWGLGVDGVIAGRALDEAPIIALPLLRGFERGITTQMGKVAEVPLAGGVATGESPSLLTLRRDHFLIRATLEGARCTPSSVAQVALYERSNPFQIAYPGGILDLTAAKYEQFGTDAVKVSGGRWISQPYTVKLEGAALVGYRFVSIAGIRDPIAISQIDYILTHLRKEFIPRVYKRYREGKDYRLNFRVFGRDGVMRDQEPERKITSHELGIIIEVVAATPDLSRSICQDALHRMLMCHFPGRRTTAGNIAYCYSPQVFDAGEAYEFAIHHLLPLDDPCEPFRIDVMDFPRRKKQ